jgi:ATP-dependent helicase/nuclease subunit B
MTSLMAGDQGAGRLTSVPLSTGAGFLDTVAAAMLERFAALAGAGDFSTVLVFVPALPIAAELRQSLVRVAARPLLLPTFETLAHWTQTAVIPDIPAPLADCERLVLLHEALRERQWFDEGALWGIASEMAGLFDELTAAAVHLPDDESALTVQLERAYALRASTPLAFEARVVHELWRALSAAGRPDMAGVYRLRLARLAEQAERPLLVLLDAAPEEALDPAEHDFLVRYAERQPVAVFHPAPRGLATTPLMTALAAAWPENGAAVAPLRDRALDLAARLPCSPLSGRLQLVPAAGREQEAQAAVAQIAQWLTQGLRRIVVITQDRLTARRVRALLEREGVLVVDETGWLLSTSRAAAAIDALIETAAGGAYHRDLLDLCKSPYVFADCAEDARKAAVFTLESAIRAASVRSGLPRFRRCLLASEGEEQTLGIALLDRIEAATTLLRSRPATLPRWIDRLSKALEVLGAPPLLQADAAGKALLDLLATRRQELDGSSALFSFAAWRDWLNRELEAASFRDASVVSPIVLTPLNAVCLRRFEAVLLIGGDARQLVPAAGGAFFNQSVRHELGLPTRSHAECELRRDLELLLATVPRVVVTWQSEQDGEANLLAPEFDLLATLHQLAWGDDLHHPPLPARREAQPEADSAPGASRRAAPIAPPALIPHRVSVSGYASLVACPYRFFARHVLGLGEMDEVSEEMGKSDYGALVHRVLERFHTHHPLIATLSEEEALAALQACVIAVFAPAVEDNFLAIGWRLRWEKRLRAYLDWQRGVEAAGWRWAQAETRVSRVLPLEGGEGVELYGRIDRIDTIGQGAASVSLLDYKTQTATKIRQRLSDDVQLPAYALLHGDAAQAAYVALDDERIVAVAAGDDEGSLMFDAAAQGERLRAVFNAMHAGAALPAHGAERECQWCEMGGLCRNKYV